jgi:hypothetical protein
MKKLLIAVILTAAALSPAAAATMACTGPNIGSAAMMAPGPSDANKELAMANTEMSKGDMKGACMHYMKAQKMSMK